MQKINGCTCSFKDASTVPYGHLFKLIFLYHSLLNAGLGCTVVISTGYSQDSLNSDPDPDPDILAGSVSGPKF
jgi:hypothetical protein